MRHHVLLAAAAVLAVSPAALDAQAAAPASTTVLSIYREVVKPGKNFAHDAHESAWTKAMIAAKSPSRFLAMTPMSGPNENWYVSSFENWAALEKANMAGMATPALAAIQKSFGAKEEEFLSDGRLMTLREHPELGYGGMSDIANMRYLTVTRVSVRPGHNMEWEAMRKEIAKAHEVAHLADKYSLWEVTSGAPAGTYYIMAPQKSLAELDGGAAMHAGAAYMAALGGDDGQQKRAAIAASAVVSSQIDRFEFAPSQSNPPEAWVTANPKFWKPAAPAAAAPAAKKPPAKKP